MKQAAGFLPTEVSEDRPGTYGSDYMLVGYRFAEHLPGEVKRQCRAIAEEVNRPAERKDVVEGLRAVSLVLPHQGDITDMEMWQRMVWLAVEEFPADVINESLRNLVKREEWRPVPAKVREECFRVGARRRAMLKLSCAGALA